MRGGCPIGFADLKTIPVVPPKLFGSAVCSAIYISIYPSEHKQLTPTVLEGRLVTYELDFKKASDSE